MENIKRGRGRPVAYPMGYDRFQAANAKRKKGNDSWKRLLRLHKDAGDILLRNGQVYVSDGVQQSLVCPLDDLDALP